MHNSLCLGFREGHPSPWGYIIKGKFSHIYVCILTLLPLIQKLLALSLVFLALSAHCIKGSGFFSLTPRASISSDSLDLSDFCWPRASEGHGQRAREVRDMAQWLERGALPMSLPAMRF